MNKAFLRAINIKMVVQCLKKTMNKTIPFLNYCCTYVTQVKCVKAKPAVELQYLDLFSHFYDQYHTPLHSFKFMLKESKRCLESY